jgi:hypothetical protein
MCLSAVVAGWLMLRVMSASWVVKVHPAVAARSRSLLETAQPLPSTVALDLIHFPLVELRPYPEAAQHKVRADCLP